MEPVNLAAAEKTFGVLKKSQTQIRELIQWNKILWCFPGVLDIPGMLCNLRYAASRGLSCWEEICCWRKVST